MEAFSSVGYIGESFIFFILLDRIIEDIGNECRNSSLTKNVNLFIKSVGKKRLIRN